jgi:hypothetical protein
MRQEPALPRDGSEGNLEFSSVEPECPSWFRLSGERESVDLLAGGKQAINSPDLFLRVVALF